MPARTKWKKMVTVWATLSEVKRKEEELARAQEAKRREEARLAEAKRKEEEAKAAEKKRQEEARR